MKANELRIGNLIKYLGGENELTYHITEAVEIDAVAENPLYEPIPLTPEILEKAGFEDTRFSLVSYNVRHKDSGFSLKKLKTKGDTVRVLYNNRIIHVTSLHQLQNIFFALTGEELKINLNP